MTLEIMFLKLYELVPISFYTAQLLVYICACSIFTIAINGSELEFLHSSVVDAHNFLFLFPYFLFILMYL